MPSPPLWTAALDTRLRQLRAEGATWEEIATALGMGRWVVRERGRRIGARRPPPDYAASPEDPRREPLPAGHPRTWNPINRGTVLQGQDYPLPVFSR